MTTPTTPTTPAPEPVPASPRSKNRGLRIALIVIGSVIIAGILISSVVNIVMAMNRTDASGTYTVEEEFTSVDIEADISDVTVSFGDVGNARIEFRQGDSARNIAFSQQVNGDEFSVKVLARGGLWWPFGDGNFFGGDSPTLDIVLPEAMADGSLDLALDATAGDVNLDGEYAAMRIDLTAGNLDLTGSATDLSIDSTAGNIDLDTMSAQTVDISSTAGDVRVDLATLPDEFEIASVAGNQTVWLPEGDYDIDTDTTAGNVTVDVPSNPDAALSYSFSSTAGNIEINER
ncbi:DUF4097 family beta strand repeat-containing protein [Diaminobutyricimonas sp. TR449]|uniref:DUF4097 family beta strand repeat-containing protein n=1 Tax=Diaminobutyricimonas sp. TR449 TaxID=2708076 RepID=UPI001422A43B|nr:DUF4097 family beta strand repeat-containing protein [Diaminobutyricimonas sp. TR449]